MHYQMPICHHFMFTQFHPQGSKRNPLSALLTNHMATQILSCLCCLIRA
jgi:hypothetical protein